jgi:hypothetical protein
VNKLADLASGRASNGATPADKQRLNMPSGPPSLSSWDIEASFDTTGGSAG